MHTFLRNQGFTWLLLAAAFYLIPYSQLDHFRMMPGDIGDARLVNYFLEHIHQYFTGSIESLWHPGFLSPFPFVLGFSESLFGSFPVYEIARLWTTETDTAFQIWFLAAYPINYLAAYLAFRRLGCSPVSASIGASIFAFSLPVTSHIGHPQLLYRFGLPMAIALYISFLQNKNWWHLLFSGFWLVWQYYCSIYIGFFASLLLAAVSVAFFIPHLQNRKKTKTGESINFISHAKALPTSSILTIGFGLIFLLLAMIWLFYPYLKVTELYGAKRSTAEIATMLPRIQSYFTANASLIWNQVSQYYPEIPMQHEHQMFVGAVPLALAFFGLLGRKALTSNSAHPLMFWSFIGSFVLTLSVFGYSLWIPLTNLPLVSAIRAVTRLDLALLFPIAYFSAVAIEKFNAQKKPIYLLAFAALTLLLIGEMSATKPYISTKAEWRERLVLKQQELPEKLPSNTILFFSQPRGPWYADELDSMWIALQKNVSTLNGYSGFLPPGYSAQFATNCAELPRRIISYLKFSNNENNPEAYYDLANRITPIGFNHCPDHWRLPRTKSQTQYTTDQIKAISISLIDKVRKNNQWIVTIEIKNSSKQFLASDSSVDKPFRLMWRFVDSHAQPVNRWQARKALPHDLPPKSTITMDLLVDQNMAPKGSTLQIIMEQKVIPTPPSLSIPWD